MRPDVFTSTYAYKAESDDYDGEDFGSEDSESTYEEVGFVAVSYDDSDDEDGDSDDDDSDGDSDDEDDDGDGD
jgi:hypothetical protein